MGDPQGHINLRQLNEEVTQQDVTARYIQMLHDMRLEPYPVLITALWAIEYVYNEVPPPSSGWALLVPPPDCTRSPPCAQCCTALASIFSPTSSQTGIYETEGVSVSLLHAFFTLHTPGSNVWVPGNL